MEFKKLNKLIDSPNKLNPRLKFWATQFGSKG